MSLLGAANWWLPRWLDRQLPHMDLEGFDFELEALGVATDAEAATEDARELELV